MDEQRKTTYTAAKKRANEKYLASLDMVHLRLPKGRKAEIQAAAAAVNESVNQYVTGAIDRRIESGS